MALPKIPTLALLGLLLAWPVVSQAQGSADDALEKLLEQLDEPSRPADAPEPDKPAVGEVAPEDRSLDSLLEKLGERTDEPSPSGGAPKPGTGPADMPGPPRGGDADARPGAGEGADAPLQGKEKALDEHLEEILGRIEKDRNEDQEGSSAAGPLAEAIRKMEEVRKRLSETDTGEQTRKKQEEVVTELEQILERLRQAQGQGSGRPSLSRRIQQAGLSKGQSGQPQGGQQPGNSGEGTGPMTPQRPNLDEILANRKDIWGDLPPQLREEMDNIFKEEMLPAKRELIMRYFSSVAEKGQAGGEP